MMHSFNYLRLSRNRFIGLLTFILFGSVLGGQNFASQKTELEDLNGLGGNLSYTYWTDQVDRSPEFQISEPTMHEATDGTEIFMDVSLTVGEVEQCYVSEDILLHINPIPIISCRLSFESFNSFSCDSMKFCFSFLSELYFASMPAILLSF